jgi:hypothetical protein
MNKHYYGTVQESNKGKFAIQIPLEYPSWGSGLVLPPVIEAQLWGQYPVVFVLNTGQAELAKAFDVNQQSVSRYLKNGEGIQELITAGTYSEVDIWGYSPTKRRMKAARATTEVERLQGNDTKLPSESLTEARTSPELTGENRHELRAIREFA